MAYEDFRSAIDACYACAIACDRCATACLEEAEPKAMAECIKRDFDCAEMCRYAAGAMARDSGSAGSVAQLCAEVCDHCAAECEQHEMEHCRECARACLRAAEECRNVAHSFS